MTDIDALIEKLERTESGSRELDIDISFGLGIGTERERIFYVKHGAGGFTVEDENHLTAFNRFNGDGLRWVKEGRQRVQRVMRMVTGPTPLATALKYTTTRDAAITLFPRGWFHQIEPRFDIPDRNVVHWWRVYGILPRPDKYDPHGGWFDNVEANHPNEFLALCIAALRAIKAKETGE